MKSFRACSLIAVYSCLIFSPSGIIVLADSQGERDSGHQLDSRKLGCNGGEVLLTRNRTLAPRRLVQASDFLTTLTQASSVYDSLITWCTHDGDADPYIDMEFTSPILITMMISSGSVINQRAYYVTNFTLEYSPPNNSSVLNYYLSTDESAETGSVKYFEGSDFITLIQFGRPFLTQRIRLRPVAWQDFDDSLIFICQGVALYGCLDTNVTEVGPVNATATLVTVTENQSLLIILPITSITIAILLVLLAVLIIYMVTVAYKKNHRTTDSGYSHLDRSQQSVELSSEGHITTTMEGHSCGALRGSSVIKKVDNPIYERDMSKQRSIHFDICTSVSESGYEPINSVETKTCEEELRYQLEDYDDGMQEDGHNSTSPGKVSEEDKKVVRSSFEPVGTQDENKCNALKDTRLNDTVSRDSMIDNTAYDGKRYVRDMLPAEGTTDVVDREEDQQLQYEEVVILESNSSYNYVASVVLPTTNS